MDLPTEYFLKVKMDLILKDRGIFFRKYINEIMTYLI